MQIVEQISPRAEQLISEYNLGQVQAEYKEANLKTGWIMSMFVLIALFCFIMLFQAGDLAQFWIFMALFLSVGGCFALIGALGITLVVIALWKGEQHIYLGDKGFISARFQIERVMHWEAIKVISDK